MKILHIIPSVSPIRGGPSHAVLDLVYALRQSGTDAEIVTTNDHGPDLLDVPLIEKIDYPLLGSPTARVPVRFFPRFSPNVNAVREFAFSSALTQWLWKNIANYDLIHVHAIFSYPSTVAMAIARQKKVPYIVRPLGQLCTWPLQQGASKKQAYLRFIELANLHHSQVIHATSDMEKEEIANLNLRAPTFVLPHGLAIPTGIPNARQLLKQKLGCLETDRIVLFLSRLHEKKGLDYLIPALGKLTNYPFKFVLAGSGAAEYESEIKKLLDEHGLAERTFLPGFVEGELKDLIMQGADFFALTSHSENFGVAVLEAMAAGLPVITTTGVALSSQIDQHQLGSVVQLDVNDIARQIATFFETPESGVGMGKRAREFVRREYSWETASQRLLKIYDSILAKGKIPEPCLMPLPRSS